MTLFKDTFTSYALDWATQETVLNLPLGISPPIIDSFSKFSLSPPDAIVPWNIILYRGTDQTSEIVIGNGSCLFHNMGAGGGVPALLMQKDTSPFNTGGRYSVQLTAGDLDTEYPSTLVFIIAAPNYELNYNGSEIRKNYIKIDIGRCLEHGEGTGTWIFSVEKYDQNGILSYSSSAFSTHGDDGQRRVWSPDNKFDIILTSPSTIEVRADDVVIIPELSHTLDLSSGKLFGIGITIRDDDRGDSWITFNEVKESPPALIYTSPITISESSTLTYWSVDANGISSPVYTEEYIIETGVPATQISQSGRSRISAKANKIQSGVSHINANAQIWTKSQLGRSNVKVTISKSQTAKASIKNSAKIAISGKSKIVKTYQTSQRGLSHINSTTTTTTKAISGLSRITKVIQKLQTGKGNITSVIQTRQKQITGLSNISQNVYTPIANYDWSTVANTTGLGPDWNIIGYGDFNVINNIVSSKISTENANIAYYNKKTFSPNQSSSIQLQSPTAGGYYGVAVRIQPDGYGTCYSAFYDLNGSTIYVYTVSRLGFTTLIASGVKSHVVGDRLELQVIDNKVGGVTTSCTLTVLVNNIQIAQGTTTIVISGGNPGIMSSGNTGVLFDNWIGTDIPSKISISGKSSVLKTVAKNLVGTSKVAPPYPPYLKVTDDFSGNLSNWTTITGLGSLSISAGTLYGSSTGGMYYSGATFDNAQYCKATKISGQYLFLCLRITGSNYYAAYLNVGGSTIQMYKVVAGALNTVGSAVSANLSAGPITMSISSTNTITVIDGAGTTVITYQDLSLPLLGGSPGLRVNGAGAFDNFEAGNVTPLKGVTQLGKANIIHKAAIQQIGKALIRKIVAQAIIGKSKILTVVTKSQVGISKIYNSLTLDYWDKTDLIYSLTTSKIGDNWTASNLRVLLNKVKPTLGSAGGYASYTGTTFLPDQFSRITLETYGTGPTVRNNAASYYFVEVASSTTANLRLMNSNNSIVTIATISGSFDIGSTIELQAQGFNPVLTVLKNGLSLGSYSYAGQYISSGSPGIAFYNTYQNGSIGTFTASNLPPIVSIQGKAKIQRFSNQTQSGRSDIKAVTKMSQSGKADIRVSRLSNIIGKAKITVTTKRSISGVSTVSVKVFRNQTGVASITRVIEGVFKIGRATVSISSPAAGPNILRFRMQNNRSIGFIVITKTDDMYGAVRVKIDDTIRSLQRS